MSKRFFVTRLLSSIGSYMVMNYSLIRVELRPESMDLLDEKTALEDSVRSFGEDISVLNRQMRISSIVEADDERQAHLLAEDQFVEAIDALSLSDVIFGRYELAKAGYVRDLSTFRIISRTYANITIYQPPGMSFRNLPGPIRPIGIEQYILITDGDLGKRLLRSLHWFRQANEEPNLQLRVLFRWFAVESICKLTTNDDVITRVLWALGFPRGKTLQELDRSILKKLTTIPTYRNWREQVANVLERIRRFRNDTVHSGFRSIDMMRTMDKSERKIFAIISWHACHYVQDFARRGLKKDLRIAGDVFLQVAKLTADNQFLIEQVSNLLDLLNGKSLYGDARPMDF